MDIKEIINEYKYKSELHVHTSPVSKCADFLPEEVVRRYAEAGVDSIVITNHLSPFFFSKNGRGAEFYLNDYYKAKVAGDALGINVILGAEIRFEENANDYLVYGISEDDIEKMISYIPKTLADFYKEFKNDKNVILQAHPFRSREGGAVAPVEYIDGIETFNLHPGHNSGPGFSTRFAKENGLLVCGGTDYHHPDHEALCLTRSKYILRDSYDVAELIKSKDLLFDMSGHIVFPYGY